MGDIDKASLFMWLKVLVVIVIGLVLFFYTQSYYALKADMVELKADNLTLKANLESLQEQVALINELDQKQQIAEEKVIATAQTRKETLDESVKHTLQNSTDAAATRAQLSQHYIDWMRSVHEDATRTAAPEG